MYTGEADWTLIGEVKRNPRITIPIIGNGDITSAEKAREAFDRYGVDGIMVGRATFGCPWIFSDIRNELDGNLNDNLNGNDNDNLNVNLKENENEKASGLTFDQKLDILKELLRINVERIDEPRGILHTRRHLAATPIFKGIPNFRPLRIAMLRATRMDELLAILDEARAFLNTEPTPAYGHPSP
jgi:tRNA-dihydrouridine synthase